ncbi:MAG: hypothetical protein K2Q22_13615 [Cytophagales bacterium]|nr:hypothetical protein [Cytophagales bacterium]
MKKLPMKNKSMAYLSAILTLVAILTAFITQNDNPRGSHEIDPQVKKEVLTVLDAYMNTFNARDAKAWQGTYHFPHYRLASGKMSVLESATLDSTVFIRLVQTGWHHSQWDHRNIIQASSDKVHVDTRFTRFKADGAVLGQYESLYIVTKENGRWGVKFRSSYAE